jgi:hypothetical protein
MENKFFYSSLGVSFLIHAFIIISLSIATFNSQPKNLKSIEVIYQDLKFKTVKETKPVREQMQLVQKDQLAKKVDLLPKKDDSFIPSGKGIKDISKFSDKMSLDKKQAPKISPADFERKITIPVLKTDKITNPKYLTYTETIRNKIRQRAYNFVDDPQFQEGKVYLTFVISSQGVLQATKIIEEKTMANSYMKEVCLRSIEESSPFPPFPNDLSYPELTFNVVISFEVSQ